MAMNNVNQQKQPVAKKAVSILSALTLLASSIGIGAHVRQKNKNNDYDVTSTTTTSVSTTVDAILEQLKLTEDFDINDKDAVNERAQEIYELSEKKVSVKMISNLIYLINGKYNKIKFSDKSTELKYIQNMFKAFSEIVSDNVIDCRNEQIGEKNAKPRYGKLIYSYMFMASTKTNSDDYIVSKSDAIEMAKIVRKQLNNIKHGKTSNYENTAEEYYKFYNSLKNRTEKNDNAKLFYGYAYSFFRDIDSKNALFASCLSKEEQKDLDENYAETYSSMLSGDVISKLNIKIQGDIKGAIDSGSFGNPVPDYGEKNNSADSKNADDKIDSTPKTTRYLNQEGGKHVGKDTKQINEPTTNVTKETKVADPTEKSKDEKNKNDKDKSNKKDEKKESTKGTTSKSTSSTVADVTTGKHEEIIDEGGETVFEGSEEEAEDFLKGKKYTDADEDVKSNSYTKTK